MAASAGGGAVEGISVPLPSLLLGPSTGLQSSCKVSDKPPPPFPPPPFPPLLYIAAEFIVQDITADYTHTACPEPDNKNILEGSY